MNPNYNAPRQDTPGRHNSYCSSIVQSHNAQRCMFYSVLKKTLSNIELQISTLISSVVGNTVTSLANLANYLGPNLRSNDLIHKGL